MRTRALPIIAALLGLAACSDGGGRATRQAAASDTAAPAPARPDSAARRAGMPGMAMDSAPRPSGSGAPAMGGMKMEGAERGGADAMPGMEMGGSSTMPGMAGMRGMPADGAARGGSGAVRMGGMEMPGMRMGGAGKRAARGMSDMPGMKMGTSRTGGMGRMSTAEMRAMGGDAGMAGMPGMARSGQRGEMAAMPAMNGPGMQGMQGMRRTPAAAPVDSAAQRRLALLVAELVRKPEVQARIERDSVLRNRWDDPEVRRLVTGATTPRRP